MSKLDDILHSYTKADEMLNNKITVLEERIAALESALASATSLSEDTENA